MRGRGLVLAFGFLVVSDAAWATTYVISPTGGGDFPNIQAAVSAAIDGDVIELLDGTYTGAGNRDIDFHGKAITVRSQRGDPESCVLDVGGSPSTPRRGFNLHSNEGNGSRIEGISVIHGYAPWGAAVNCYPAAPWIQNCRFAGTIAGSGSAVAGGSASDPFQVVGCLFQGNPGGALAVADDEIVIRSCQFYSNSARTGGAICVNSAYVPTHVSLAHCTFDGNSAIYHGGAVYCASENHTECEIDSCDFRGNYAYQDGSAVYAGGSDRSCIVTINQSTFVGNEDGRGRDGGSIYGTETGALHISNCIVAFNRGRVGGVMWIYGTIACTDLYGNEGHDYSGFYPLGHDGNISEDPLFCGLESGDYTINAASPCAPSDETLCGLIGLYPVGCGGSGVADLGPGTNETIRVIPNPTAGACTISLTDRPVPAGTTTRGTGLEILDASGRLVRSLAHADVGGRDDANDDGLARQSILWDGRDASGRAVPSGVYFVRVGGGRCHGTRLTVIR
jgi:predicted outer membrane repeat protein